MHLGRDGTRGIASSSATFVTSVCRFSHTAAIHPHAHRNPKTFTSRFTAMGYECKTAHFWLHSAGISVIMQSIGRENSRYCAMAVAGPLVGHSGDVQRRTTLHGSLSRWCLVRARLPSNYHTVPPSRGCLRIARVRQTSAESQHNTGSNDRSDSPHLYVQGPRPDGEKGGSDRLALHAEGRTD